MRIIHHVMYFCFIEPEVAQEKAPQPPKRGEIFPQCHCKIESAKQVFKSLNTKWLHELLSKLLQTHRCSSISWSGSGSPDVYQSKTVSSGFTEEGHWWNEKWPGVHSESNSSFKTGQHNNERYFMFQRGSWIKCTLFCYTLYN